MIHRSLDDQLATGSLAEIFPFLRKHPKPCNIQYGPKDQGFYLSPKEFLPIHLDSQQYIAKDDLTQIKISKLDSNFSQNK